MPRLLGRPLPWGLVVAYALIAALLVGAYYARVAPQTWQLQGARAEQLRGTIEAHRAGGPPLARRCLPRAAKNPLLTRVGIWCPVGISDDQGASLFLPLVADVTGTHDPGRAFRELFIAAYVVAASIWVVAFYALFGTVAAVAAPLLLVIAQHALTFPDVYWVGGWVVLALIPAAVALARARPRIAVPIWLVLLIVASAASSIRSQAGLPLLVADLVVLVLRNDLRVLIRLPIAAAMVVAYLSVTSIVMPAAKSERADNPQAALTRDVPSGHVVWHSLYIGLGYLPNSHHIWWIDRVGEQKAHSINPKIVYLSSAYERTMRHEVKNLVINDPGFVASQEARKVVVAIWHVAVPLALLSVALALLLSSAAGREFLRLPLWAVAPALPLGLLSAIFGLPVVEYEQTWRAAAWLTLAFAAAAALRLAQDAIARGGPERVRLRLSRGALVGLGAGLIVAVAAAATGPSIADRAAAWLKKGEAIVGPQG